MFTYTIGKWTLIFEQNYRIIQDESTAVVIDSERTALVLISLTADGNICIERTYYDKYPYGKPQTDEVARGSGNREYGCRRLREKLPNFSGVSFFRAGNSSNRVNAFHICVYVHRCAVPRYIALQHP